MRAMRMQLHVGDACMGACIWVRATTWRRHCGGGIGRAAAWMRERALRFLSAARLG
jgi:hypothetical protein